MLDSTTVYGNVNENILDYSAILEVTVKDIQNFLTEFGRVYSFIGDKFPLIEQEMKNENEKSISLLSYFTEKDTKKNFSSDFQENQEDFFKSFDRMQSLINQDDVLSNSIIEDVNIISNVMDSIEEIRKLADQIKVYSLNAIIIASKYGSGGKAFGEISKNIIKMSETSNEQADQMNRIGQELFVQFDRFKDEILKTNEMQRRSFNIMREQLDKEHNNMVNSFATFSNMISDIISRVDNSYDYIFEVMMILPQEDIIRQQTEHIIESIKHIVEENRKFIDAYGKEVVAINNAAELENNESLEHKLLDLLTFDDVVLSLIIENFKSIHKEILDNNARINDSLKGLKESLLDISSDRNTIVEYMIGAQSGKSEFPFSVSDSIFNEYLGFIKLYLDNFKLFLSNKHRISDNNAGIIDSIEELENMFLETKNIAKAFNSINFLAKIELEKNSDIFSDSQTFSMVSVESIATNITDTVDVCLEKFENIKTTIFSAINKFKFNINQQSIENSFIESMMDNIYKRLEESKTIIEDNIKGLDTHAKELFNLIEKTLIDLSSLTTLLTKINEIMEVFNRMRDIIRNKKNEYYKTLNIENWKIESDKYMEIVNYYTIKKERTIANSILSGEEALNVDINIEEGSDSGDFTLF
ncbi:methyl-accepting chemotaxis sensory transducer [Brachyspira pilosicoli WesB]|uniref:Methyl-accepting chemotaxis sensory transducer n=1 Tax=Brachyspira pilosicoli WesB TaxID=1161918 RepID=K0JLT1_BRAPL|nr:methyl-accepting chemotaxis sensory transducer [Brachyspira pilosicoli]CCG57226.1 methyl-accepting chemotaxis sensory transducer [Brachyspira pilosicoli WesB]